MKAIILAAGRGTRLKPITDNLPKALLTVNNSKLLDRHLNGLKSIGINEITIVVGFKKELIIEHLNTKRYDLKISFVENEKFENTKSSYSLWLALQQNGNEPVVFMDADLYYDPKLFEYVKDRGNGSHLLVGKNEIDDESVKVMGENNIVREIGKNVGDNYHCYGEAVGIIILDKSDQSILLRNLKDEFDKGNLLFDWEENLNLTAGIISIKIVDIGKTKWIEIDNIKDYENACNLICK